MKKIVLVLALFTATSMASNAFVDNEYMKTAQFMTNTGYSAEMANVLTITTSDPYREPFKDSDQRTFKDVTRKIYHYFAPTMYTNYDFYNHSIKSNVVDWRDL